MHVPGLSGQSRGGPEEAAWTFSVPIKLSGDPFSCQSYVNRVGLPKFGPESLSSETLFPPLTRGFLTWQGTFTCRCSSGGCSSLEEGWRAVSSTPAEPGKRFLTPVNEPAPLPAMRPWNIIGVYVQKQLLGSLFCTQSSTCVFLITFCFEIIINSQDVAKVVVFLITFYFEITINSQDVAKIVLGGSPFFCSLLVCLLLCPLPQLGAMLRQVPFDNSYSQ